MRTLRIRWNLCLIVLATGLAAACMSSSDEEAGYEPSQSGAGGKAAGAGGSTNLPPELELEANFKAPVITQNFLFTANPKSNRVALIDGDSLEVTTLDSGHEPTFLTALPETKQGSGALVLNVKSHDVSLYRLPSGGAPKDITTERVPVHPGANAWQVSREGTFAIAWTKAEPGAASSDGFQDITIVEPTLTPVTTRIGVGFRPSAVHIASDEKRAVVVSDPGLTVIELGREGTSGVVAEYPLPSITSGARDVSITPDGEIALVRLEGQSALLAVQLDTGAQTEIELPGPLSDLDLSSDGEIAVGVIRSDASAPSGRSDTGEQDSGELGGQAQGGGAPVGPGPGGAGAGGEGGEDNQPDSGHSWIVLFSIRETMAPTLIPVADVMGSVSLTNQGETALLYSNAAANSHIWLFDTKSHALRLIDVRSAVRAVLPTPNGQFAVALLQPPSGSTRAGAFALIPVDQDLPPRIEGTLSPTAQVAFSPQSDAVVITTRSAQDGKGTAYVGRFPRLSVDEAPLPSPPLAAGVMGSLHKGFIAQEHPEGRITFIGLTSGAVTTLTGYELGSRVVE